MRIKTSTDIKINILFIDLNIQYIGPTRNLVPSMLNNKFNVTIFGPGFTSEIVLKDGLDSFYKKNGPFDFILASEHVFFYKNTLQDNKGKSLFDIFSSSYVVRFKKTSLLNFFTNTFDFLKRTKVKKIITMFETDLIYISKAQLDILLNLNCYIIGQGQQLIKPSKKLQLNKSEKFSEFAGDNWSYFVKKNNHKIISLPYFVSENEFFYGDIQNRNKIINVPGVNYYNRKRAIKLLDKAKIKMDKKYYMLLFSFLSRLGLRPFSNPHLLKMYNNIFSESIINSKYCFSCGSTAEITLRKFFEIPALGSLLILEPFSSKNRSILEALGYVDGYNYISCPVEDIVEKIYELESNINYASEVALRGQEMISANHSSLARCNQIYESLVAIIRGDFKGTFWNKGIFELIR